MQYSDTPIAIVGLGYVGLPLAVEFGRKRNVIGFDINESRVKELKKGIDKTLETTDEELKGALYLRYSNNLEDLKECNIFIITVPTPIDKNKQPNLSPLKDASEAIGSILKKGDFIYLDPPYIEFEKEYDSFRRYNGVVFSKSDLEDLALEANRLKGKCKILISNFDQRGVKDYFTDKDWKFKSIKQMTYLSGKKEGRKHMNEALIYNY